MTRFAFNNKWTALAILVVVLTGIQYFYGNELSGEPEFLDRNADISSPEGAPSIFDGMSFGDTPPMIEPPVSDDLSQHQQAEFTPDDELMDAAEGIVPAPMDDWATYTDNEVPPRSSSGPPPPDTFHPNEFDTPPFDY